MEKIKIKSSVEGREILEEEKLDIQVPPSTCETAPGSAQIFDRPAPKMGLIKTKNKQTKINLFQTCKMDINVVIFYQNILMLFEQHGFSLPRQNSK